MIKAAMCVGIFAALFLVWLILAMRSRQLTHQIRRRIDARLAERERIASELHDTLLQSVQGLVLRFQSVADMLPVSEPARGKLEAALARADGVIIEGRNRVRDLRLREGPNDFSRMISDQVNLAGLASGAEADVSVIGAERSLRPVVAAELSCVAGEALSNILRHADANRVQVVLTFETSRFTLRISDDGIGLPPGVLAGGGRNGHYGLTGMRERSKKLGGHLSIERGTGAGTVVSVTVPARLAFTDFTPNLMVRWFSALRSSKIDE
ncbi:sensor histidine kinase [Novosphingobium sp. HR1a]|uniref:sensor histidine kinase n=1 Tax=Novosphingobium sp. HR1a TaxID=1395637 RepID=UPI001B3C7A04|nr:ATP-binding protein [Novosphingobium sp. HR1a]